MGDTPIGKLIVELGLNTGAFENGIDAAQKRLKTLNTAIKGASSEVKAYGLGSASVSTQLGLMTKAFKQNEGIVKLHKERIAEATRKIEDHREKLAAQGKTVSETDAVVARHNKTIERSQAAIFAATGAMADLQKAYHDLAKAQAEANNPFIQTGERLTAMGKRATESGNRILNVSRALAPVTAAIGATVGASFGIAIKAASDYETALTNVSKTTDPTTAQLRAFEKGFRDLAKTIPVSAAELANMGSVAGQLGIHNENILTFVETMAKLQTATNIVGEEGAKDLARFMNVMGTSQDKVSNLGSALVDLGNNFATSEQEILNMAKNLSGIGKVTGLSEGDVLGLATALSAVGIEAEKGGSAMSKFIGHLKVGAETGMVGKVSFEEFAKVAGMTVDEFTRLTNDDMASAVERFLSGLHNMDEDGSSALLSVLELGLGEVRLKDTLLRASSASDQFSKAIKTGNKAFEENTALQNEYQKFSETTASKFALLKNKLIDVAIQMGEKLLPAVKELLDNSDGFIDWLKGMIEGFNSLPGGVKTAIGAFTALTAAISPFLGVLGQGKLAFGLFSDALGGLLKHIGQGQVAKQSFDLMATGIGGVTSAAGAAEGAVGAIGTAASSSTGLLSGLISLPVLAWAGGIAAALGLGWLAWKKWGEGAWNAAQETKRHEETVKQWGVDVGAEVDGALEKVENASRDSQLYMNQWFTVTEETKEQATTSVTGVFQSMSEAAQKHFEEHKKVFEKLPLRVQELAQEEYKKREQANADIQKLFGDGQKRVNEIYEKASKERRRLTEEEVAEINTIQTRAQAELAKILGKNDSEAQKIFNNLIENTKELSDKQISQRVGALEKMRKAEEEHYTQEKQDLEEALSYGYLTRKQYNEEIRKTEEQHHTQMKQMAFGMYQTLREQQKRLSETGHKEEAKLMDETIKNMLTQYGTSIEEMDKMQQKYYETMAKRNRWISQNVKDLTGTITEETTKANTAWESLITSDATGEITNNIQWVLREALKTEEGWNNLHFIVQNATLTTDAKEAIKEALIASEKWESLTFEEKKILLDSELITESEHKAIELRDLWNSTEFVEKLAKIDTTAPNARKEIHDLLETYGIADNSFQKPLTATAQTNSPEIADKVKKMHDTVEDAQRLMSQGADLDTTTNAPDTQEKVEGLTDAVNGVPTSHTTIFDADTSRAEWAAERIRRIWANVNSYGVSTQAIWSSYINGGHNATGTSYFEGGLTWLGDGKRREPFLTPEGHFGISPATDTLYFLPRGTKVWPSVGHFKEDARHSSLLASFLDRLPKFATGTPRSFLDKMNITVPDVVTQAQTVTNNSTYAPVLHIEHFHANDGQDEETLFKKFAWLVKREGDRL